MARRRATRKGAKRGYLSRVSASMFRAPKSVARTALRVTRARPIMRKLYGAKR